MPDTSALERCPFYGFHQAPAMKALLSSQGNQCGLITASISPCKMEIAGAIPDWQCCALNTNVAAPIVLRMRTDYRIYPRELWPEKGASLSNGIEFEKWFRMRMGEAKAPAEGSNK